MNQNSKPQPILQSDIGEWLQHPITRVLVYNLRIRIEQQIRECGMGGAFVESDGQYTLSENYHFYQGAIQELGVVLGTDVERHMFKEFLKYSPDLIINDEDDDDAESKQD